jgi:hypothetical protein
MSNVTISVEGREYAVELDSDGRIEGVGKGPSFTEWHELPVALRVAISAKIRIVRERVILPDNRPHTYLRGCIDGRDCSGHNISELVAACAAGAESVDWVDNPRDAALRASTILAGDKGIANHVECNDYHGFDVVADNGRRFRFCGV